MALFSIPIRIYYEDTDTAGIVYYANYLRFLERGRTELLRSLGIQQSALAARRIAFAVRSVNAEYLKPAKLDDLLVVETRVADVGRAQVMFNQQVKRNASINGILLLEAQVRVACIDPVLGKPIAMPQEIHQQFTALTEKSA
ncbi:MAG: tol-pal system-associated acyl-CoA thioesterase [Rugosibacter sp.]|jgi:acyl-CoA thioester hydrolase|nr:acyl-CoA thioester hydrolase [Rugosibacter sp.]